MYPRRQIRNKKAQQERQDRKRNIRNFRLSSYPMFGRISHSFSDLAGYPYTGFLTLDILTDIWFKISFQLWAKIWPETKAVYPVARYLANLISCLVQSHGSLCYKYSKLIRCLYPCFGARVADPVRLVWTSRFNISLQQTFFSVFPINIYYPFGRNVRIWPGSRFSWGLDQGRLQGGRQAFCPPPLSKTLSFVPNF